MSAIDFKEIKDGLDWEHFAQAFFKHQGYTIVEVPSSGSDGGTGKDLIIESELTSNLETVTRRYLVSCKHYAHSGNSVKIENEKLHLPTRLGPNKCNGFIAFYSTHVSNPLQENLIKEKNIMDYKIDVLKIYNSTEIEGFLLKEENEILFKEYFPISYKKWVDLSNPNIEKNNNFKKLQPNDFKSEDPNYYKNYLEGQPAIWSIIEKHTFKRDVFEEAVKKIETNKICLINAAGGEGKTTLSMQLGIHFYNLKFEVYYCFESISNLDIPTLKFDSKKKYLIIIDNAESVSNLYGFISKVKILSNVFVLLSSRKNEWNHFIQDTPNKEDIKRFLGPVINLTKLSNHEIDRLKSLLEKHSILNDATKDNLPDFINNNENNFLLSVMYYATQGKSFGSIIEDVIDKIASWENSDITLKVIGYIVCIEILNEKSNKLIYCKESLLKELIEIKDLKTYQQIKKELEDEAFFQGVVKDQINTRNPIIAKLFFDYLFQSSTSLFDKYDFYHNIALNCIYKNDYYSKIILANIPPYFIESDLDFSKKMLKDIISFGFFWETYYDFITLEINAKNFGSYDSTEYSARMLYLEAYNKNSLSSRLYEKWAKFEYGNGNIGNDINEKYSARWISFQGIKNKPPSNLYIIWANIEAKNNNIGNDINDEYSARWICFQGFNNKPSKDLYITWANIEAKNNNVGKNINEEYSARWICFQGFNNNPSNDLYTTWANIEAENNNVGKDINEKYSARWICFQGFNNKPSNDLYTTWANIEAKNNNVGKDINEKYSARWICSQGTNNKPTNDLYITWANIEAENNNVGNDINDEYSARWICFQGFNNKPSNDLYTTWANIEAKNNNVGKNIKEEYSARWICFQGFNNKPNSDLYTTWANIEAKNNNVGKNINDEYSARWICFQGIKIKPTKDLYVTWANIEAENNNVGSDINELYSARWICNEGFKKSYGFEVSSSWIKIEIDNRNIGEHINDKYSARWICNDGFKNNYKTIIFKWIVLEFSLNNIGSESIEYSSKWLFNYMKKSGWLVKFNNTVFESFDSLSNYLKDDNTIKNVF